MTDTSHMRDQIIAAREKHDTSLLGATSHPGYGWACICGVRRPNLVESSVDLGTALREMNEHEADAIVAALGLAG